MIDGIKFTAQLNSLEELLESGSIQLFASVDLKTGEQLRREWTGRGMHYYNGRFELYRLKVYEKWCPTDQRIVYMLIVTGSIHKNHFGGRNDGRLQFENIIAEINHICLALGISSKDCELRNLEVGTNIEMLCPVTPFIENRVLLHQTTPLGPYAQDRKGVVLGRYAKHSQYSVKCYDKGVQYNLPVNVMRFENRYVKMQPLKPYLISTLHDLTDPAKLSELLKLLVVSWDDVLISNPDITSNIQSVSENERELLAKGQYRDYWIKLHKENPKQFYRSRTRFKKLNEIYSSTNAHALVRDLIEKEIATFKAGMNLPVSETFLPTLSPAEDSTEDIFTIKINCNPIMDQHSQEYENNQRIEIPKNSNKNEHQSKINNQKTNTNQGRSETTVPRLTKIKKVVGRCFKGLQRIIDKMSNLIK